MHLVVGDFQPPNLNGAKPSSKESQILDTPFGSLGANVNSKCLTQMGAVLCKVVVVDITGAVQSQYENHGISIFS